MSTLLQDISFSFRLLRRRPVTTALIVTALALGVGLSTAMFSILWGTVLRGLPFQDADRLVRVEIFSQGEKIAPGDEDFLAWRRRQNSFEGMSAWLGSSFNLIRAGGTAERCNGAFVSANLFRLVQVPPVLGRDFREDDEAPGAPLVAVLSHALWKNHFRGDPNVLGMPIKLNGLAAQVVGVMPAGFGFPLRQEIWVPLQLDAGPKQPGRTLRVQVLGKLREGASRRQAEAELRVIAASQPVGAEEGIRVTPFVKAYTEDLQPGLHALFGASLGLLLVVCANVAGLLTAQTVTRLPELAVRSAVGATRSRLLRQLLTETLLLAAAGAALSLPLAAAALRVYVASQGGELRSFWMDVRLDPAATVYALAIAFSVSLLSAMLPSLQVTGSRLNEVLKRGAGPGTIHSPGTASTIRIVLQLALSFALLIATGLLIASFRHMGHLAVGWAPDQVLTARLLVPYATYATPADQIRFFNAVEHNLEEALGPGRTAFASTLPGDVLVEAEIEIEGQPLASGAQWPKVPYLIVSRGYFRVLHVDALAGRLFESSDRAEGQPVTVVNQSFARRYFGSRPPAGARFRFHSPAGPGPWRTVVGVVPDLVMGEARNDMREGAYVLLDQAPSSWMAVLLRTPDNPAHFAKALRRAVAAIDPEIPVFQITTLQETAVAMRLPLKTMGQVFLAFGAMALFLSVLGIYGVTAQSVAGRGREMAIRLTLGGQKRDLLRVAFAKALLQIFAGITLGILLSLGMSRYLESLLFGIEPHEPGIFWIVGCAMLLAGVLACLFPLATILRIQPARALRGD